MRRETNLSLALAYDYTTRLKTFSPLAVPRASETCHWATLPAVGRSEPAHAGGVAARPPRHRPKLFAQHLISTHTIEAADCALSAHCTPTRGGLQDRC